MDQLHDNVEDRSGGALLARLDRVPVWPYPKLLLWTIGAGYFFAFVTTMTSATGVAMTDGLGHLGGAIAPQLVLWAVAIWGFAGGLTLMAISGVVTAVLLPLAVNTTGRSLEATA